MDFCPHCMSPIQGNGTACPVCGGDLTWKGQAGIDLPVGTVLTGGNGLRSFIIGAARGKGGFGITYVAMETHSHRRVAIKEYFPTRCAFRAGNGVNVQAMTSQDSAFQGGMRSFLEEARMLLAQEDLPTVVKVIDYFQANGTAYLVMEYLDGVALHNQMIKMGGRIPAGELLPRMEKLIRDMGLLHSRGVIHRDVSPDNIMWMPDGGLKLMDFGSARSTEDGKSMTVLLKQGFSPIEQYRSRGQGPYTDVYALAATIYYCLTGTIPPSAVERLDADPLQPPNSLGAGITARQEEAILWGLTVQPKDRPQTMEEFAARLYQPEAASAPHRPAAVPPTGPGPEPQAQQQTQWQTQQQAQPQQAQPQTQQQAQAPQEEVNPPYASGGNGQEAGTPIGRLADGLKERFSAGGDKKPSRMKRIAVTVVGAIVCILVSVPVSLWMQDVLDRPSTQHTPPPVFSSAPSFVLPTSTPILPSTGLDITETGVTEDGYSYEIYGGEYAVLTGFEGNGTAGFMPDDIDGVPITAIADNAFAGVPMGGGAFLPIDLETIGAAAFRGCSDLERVYAYSAVTTQSNSFQGAPLHTVLLNSSSAIGGWAVPEDCRIFFSGMQTAVGKVTDFYYGPNWELYGVTDQDSAVLLDVPAGTTSLTLRDTAGSDDCPVQYVDDGALDRLSSSGIAIRLPDACIFDYSLFSKADWTAAPDTVSNVWLVNCELADAINAIRPQGAVRVAPDLALVAPAAIRAGELLEKYDSVRPDGTTGWDLLDEQNVDRSFGGSCYSRNYDDLNEIRSDGFDFILESYGGPITEEQSKSQAGKYVDQLGLAWATEADGELSWFCYLIIS